MSGFKVVVYLSATRGDETPETLLEVNAEEPKRIESDVALAEVMLRIKGYNEEDDKATGEEGASTGPVLDFGEKSPKGQTYFIQPARRSDLYSLQFSLRFKEEITGDDLVLSNEVDQKISLPWGTGAALKIAQWIDPGLEHNIYDETTPWLHGAVLSSINDMVIRKATDASSIQWPDTLPLEEDTSVAAEAGLLPSSAAQSASKRKRHFLGTEAKQAFTFSPDYQYDFDFHNGFVDFHRMKLCLPGFKIDVLPYWNGQSCFRYVLRTRKDERVLFVLTFRLMPVS